MAAQGVYFNPHVEYVKDGFIFAIKFGLPLLLMLSLLFSALTIVRVSLGPLHHRVLVLAS